MWEILYIASSLRLPIVLAVANRALSAPINIHCDHSDAMGMRDAGWVQLFVENTQEAYDTTIQAFRIAEHPEVHLPVAVNLDGFILSHTLEDIRMLPDEEVHKFLGGHRKVAKTYVDYLGKEVEIKLDPQNPVSFGPLDLYDYYFEHKIPQVKAMEKAKDVVREIHDEWAELTGRRYGDGVLDPYEVEDADIIITVLGSTSGTVRNVVRQLRKDGVKIGVLRIRMFRPFPFDEVRDILKGAKIVGVMDRAVSFGSFGPSYLEINTALYGVKNPPQIINYVYGLGGRDMPPQLVRKMIDELRKVEEGEEVKKKLRFLGVRE